MACVPNGVDEQLIREVAMGARAEAAAAGGAARPLTLLYTSSYDRGLEPMLRHGWPRILASLPGATLHLYYGWETHELLHRP